VTDVLARGVLEVAGDSSSFEAAMVRAEAAASRFEQASVQSAGKATAALAGVGKNAATGVEQLDSVTKRFVSSVEREIAALGSSREEFRKFEAQTKGISDTVYGPLIKRLTDTRAAQLALAEATKQASANEAFIAGLKREAETLGLTRVELLKYEAAQRGLTGGAVAQYIAQIEKANTTTGKLGVSAAQTANAMRQLPAQFTDIVTSLQGGQAPLTVLLQQGGQIKDSFGGIGNTFKALGGLITPVRLAIAGAVGAVLALGLAYQQGAKEAQEYRKALVLTGNAAGSTVGQLQQLAVAVSANVGTQGKAAEVIAVLAASGRIAASEIGKLAEAAIRLEREGGPAAEKTAEAFAELGKEPLKASLKLNESTHFLTIAVIEQIRALEEQGRVAEAAAVAQNAAADVSIKRAKELEGSLGTLQKAWRGVTDFAKSAWDAMLGIGRAETVESRLADITKELEKRRAQGPINPLTQAAFEKGNARLLDEQSVLQSDARQLKRAAEQKAAQVQLVEAYEKAIAANKKWAEAGLSDTQKLNKALTEYRQNLATIQQGRQSAGLPVLSDAEIKAQEKAIRDSIIKPAEDGTKAYERLLQGITKTVAETEAEAAGVDKLTPIQKARLDIYSKLGSELANLTVKQKIGVAAALDEAEAREAVALQTIKANKAIADAAEAQVKYIAQLDAENKAQEKLLEGLRDQIVERAAGKVALEEYRTAQLLVQATALEIQAISQQENSDNQAAVEGLKRKAQGLRDEAALRTQLALIGKSQEDQAAAEKAAKQVQDAYDKTFDYVEKNLADALISGGKTAAAALKDIFRRLVLEPIIKTALQPLTSAVTNAVATNPASALGGAASLASGGSSLFSSISAGASGIYKSVVSYAVPAVVAYASYEVGKGIANGFQVGSNGIANLINSLGVAGGLVNRLFGTKLGDSGIQGTLGGSAGFSGTAFQDIKGGFFRSDSTKTSAIDPALAEALATGVKTVRDQTAAYAQALGLPVDAIKSYTQDIKLSLKDLSPEQIKQKITDTFTAFGSELAKPLEESLTPFRKAGEDTAATLARLGESIAGVNPVLKQLGLQLLSVSAQGGDAASQLADLFGGVANLAQAGGNYYQKFYTEAERAGKATEKVTEVLAGFGLQLPASREAFRSLVEAQDLTTDSGRKAFTALLGVADAFDSVQVASKNASDAAAKLSDDLASAISSALPKFLTPGQQSSNSYQQIAASLQKAGVLTASADLASVLKGATKEDIFAFAKAFVELGDASTEAKTAVVKAADALADLKDKAAETAKRLADELSQAITTALPKFQTPEQRTQTQYQTIAQQLQAAGVLTGTPDLASVLAGSDKRTIFDFASQFVQLADVSDEAKIAVVNAASALADIKDAAAQAAKALQAADLQSQLDGIAKVFGDLSVIDTTKTISQQYVENKQQLDQLQQSLANLLGTVGKSVQEVLADLIAQQRAIVNFRASLLDSIGAARLRGLSPSDRVAALRGQEASLFSQLGTASDPVTVAQKLQGVILDRIKAEAELRQSSEQLALDLAKKARATQIDTLRAQIDGYQRLQRLAQDIAQFTGSLKFSDLSPLSFGDQLSAARALFEDTLAKAKAGDANAQGALTGNARAFLDEARSYYASSAAYNDIFQQVTGSLDALGATGVNADPQIQQLNAQLDSLTALNDLQTTVVDTSADEVAALTRVYDLLGTRETETKAAVDAQTALAQQQIDNLKTLVEGQEAQLRQQAAIAAALTEQLKQLNATTAAELANSTLLSNNPGVVAGG